MTQLEHFLSVGVLTGSRAFNCETSASDWDIVVLESDYHKYRKGTILNYTSFKEPKVHIAHNGQSYYGFDLSEINEFENKSFLEYDKHTIWGPLTKLVKYISDDTKELINLFVYEDKYADILPKFKELNDLMNFIYGSKLKDKSVRIKAFTEVISKIGITDFML